MKRYSLRQDGKRFGVEALCLLMVLYGAPVQALLQAGPVVVPEHSDDSGESLWETVTEEAEAAIATTTDAVVDSVRTVAGQPWTDALAIVLATATGEEAPPYLTDAVAGPNDPRFDSVPPLPPGFSEAAQSTRRAGVPGLAPTAQTLEASKNHLEAIPALPGWNLLSIPEEPADPDPAVVLAPIAGSFDRVFAYDACDPSDPWKLYDPADAAASDLLDLDPTQGFWLDGSAPASLPSAGTLAPTTSWQLCTGWNLIGYPAGEPRHVRNALQSIDGKYLRVFGFDLADVEDPWEIWDAAAPEWANDLTHLRPGFGYWVLVTEDVTLTIANEGDAPTVAITAPTDLAEVTAPTVIRGTISSPILESWNLAYRLVGEPEWIELATGAFPVTDAPLATFDPTLLLNGLYEVRLEAIDIAGMAVEETIAVSVEGQMKIGHFSLSFVDLAIPLAGLDIRVLRNYDSRDPRTGDFGPRWALEIQQGSYRNNRLPGDGWQINEGFLPCDSVVETKTHVTTVRLSEQEIYRFRAQLVDPAPTLGGCFARAVFEFVDGPFPNTILEIPGNDEVFWSNASNEVLDVDTLEVFEPESVLLTTSDGRVFTVDLTVGVTRLEDANGNALDFSPAGITHSSGRGIDFQRDAEGRIETITDPLGNVLSYRYDARGDLVETLDFEEHATQFVYDDDHRILEIIDPRGIRAVRNDYDSEGRLVAVTDAQGNAIQFAHDIDGRREVVTDRLGFASILEYDERGNIVREVDELGNATVRVFDNQDRLLREEDSLGQVTEMAFDGAGYPSRIENALGHALVLTNGPLGNPLTLRDPLGRVTTNAYDASGNLLTSTDPLGNTINRTYDGSGNLLTQTDPLGATTSWSYDGFGNIVEMVDPLGNTTGFAYDVNGNELSQSVTRTLPDGSTRTLVTTFTRDRMGRVTEIGQPDGTTIRQTYDPTGQISSVVDGLGRTTSYTYDAGGRPTQTTFPDGSTASQTYDAEGRRVSFTDRAGRSTAASLDARGNATVITLPDGGTIRHTYDAAGRMVASTDPAGGTVQATYDLAGRRTALTDALGNVTVFGYDPNGRPTSVTDALGRTTAMVYDELGRRLETELPDGTTLRNEYDAAGRTIAEIDGAGVRTELAYDDSGRLIEVTDALGGVTRYGYDEVGNRISWTDALGRTTRFEFDDLGRGIGRVLPDGSTERARYDAAGRRVEHTDFDGGTTLYSYDSAGRLVERTLPDGSRQSWTYTATGQRASATDARGTTQYFYDAADRLLRFVDVDGRELRFTYDALGNPATRVADLGVHGTLLTAWTHDAVGRLTAVVDTNGDAYSFAYDAVGNRTTASFPNGVETAYQYDAANRLSSLTTTDSGGSALQSFDYSYGPAGNQVAVTELDGTQRTFGYDALYHLVSERVVDSTGALVGEESFTYDAVGNRLSETRVAGDGSSQTLSYTYDNRDRLISAGGAAFTWDANGQLLSRGGADAATFTWDAANRLARADLADGRVLRHTYDSDGVRVGTTVEQPDGSLETSDFLVDTSGTLSHIVADLDDQGAVRASYTRGRELLAEHDSATHYVHADGLGSTRALSDSAGALTDEYAYSAFGQLEQHTGSSDLPFLFAGEAFDRSSGLYQNRARWMDPGVGRFLSPDPLAGARSPAVVNPYPYVESNPTNRVDPTGLISAGVVAFAMGALIGGIIGGIDAYLAGGDVRLGIGLGAAYGALLGPIFGRLMQSGGLAYRLLLIGGAGAGGYSVGSAIQSGNYKLAAFRGLLLIIGLWLTPMPGRRVALDADTIVKFNTPEVQAALGPDDVLVALPNVQAELSGSVGIKDVAAFLRARGIRPVDPSEVPPGTAVPASAIRKQLDSLVRGVGNAGDGLNISEAGAFRADIFITNDKNTIGALVGEYSILVLPYSGRQAIPIQVIQPPG